MESTTVHRALLARASDPSASIFGSISSLPAGANPFQYIYDQIESMSIYDSMRPWWKANMGSIGIIMLLAALLHLASLVFPLLCGPKARSKYLWIARTRHSATSHHRLPYLVANGRFFVSAFSIITAALFVAQTVMMLWYPQNLNGGFYWLPLIPFVVVFNFVPYDALFAVWISPSVGHRKGAKWFSADVLKNPWLINILCWGVPVVAIVAEIVLVARLFKGYRPLNAAQNTFMTTLKAAADGFEAKGIAGANIALLTQQGNDLADQLATFRVVQRQAAIGEACVMIFASALFLVSLILLFNAVWSRLGLFRRPARSVEQTVVEQQSRKGITVSGSPPATVSVPPSSHRPTVFRLQRDVRRALRMLLAYFSLLALLVFFITGCTIYIWANLDAVAVDAHLTLVCFLAMTWPIAIMLFLLGGLSLSRVLRDEKQGETSTADASETAARQRGSPARVGLFDAGEDRRPDDDPTITAPPSTTPGLEAPEHDLNGAFVTQEGRTSTEEKEDKEAPRRQPPVTRFSFGSARAV